MLPGLVAVAVLVAALAGVAAPPAGAQTSIDSLRAEAKQAAAAYLDALERSGELEAQITQLEAKLPDLEARRAALRAAARDRAVAAYRSAGSNQHLTILIGTDDVLTAARRAHWIDQLNARDDQTFQQLQQATNQLESQRSALRKAKDDQQAATAQMEARSQEVDAKLKAAEAQAAAAARPASPASGGNGGGTSGGGPGAPPPNYVPTGGTHPMHDHPFLGCTRGHESGGNYGAVSPSGTYRGVYQFAQATWNSTVVNMGRWELYAVPPDAASPYDQDDAATALARRSGAGPWNGRCAEFLPI